MSQPRGQDVTLGYRLRTALMQTGFLSVRGIVKKITGCLQQNGAGGRMFFVKKFASPEKACKTATSRVGLREIEVAESVNREGRKPVSPTGSRLARMLRPQADTMHADFSSMMVWGQTMTAPPRHPVDIPREWSDFPGFFCFVFLCENFHKSVGTHSRPLRGGKEGSVCRAM